MQPHPAVKERRFVAAAGQFAGRICSSAELLYAPDYYFTISSVASGGGLPY
jgi:hypothetical protein